MDSCPNCGSFFRASFTCLRHERWETQKVGSRQCTSDERLRIKESAQDCKLCGIIYIRLKKAYGSAFDEPDDPESFLLMSITAFPSKLQGNENLFSQIYFYFKDNDLNYLTSAGNFCFSLWANGGTPASATLVTYPPILHGGHLETVPFIQRCLDKCRDQHSNCRLEESVTDADVELPSRVLAIRRQSGGISVNLVESRGQKGSYCALSHCWGPEEKRPLKTTTQNVGQHSTSIPWSKLPRTFRDAITIVGDLGIKYLWIDSLCIVQDDKKDWEEESKKMAFVYKRATVVLAAVAAKDSTQGLYLAKRPEPLTFQLPYYTAQGSVQGSYNLALQENSSAGNAGPLETRAWVFQEWYLGRRIVFFTSKGVQWGCKFLSWDECGGYGGVARFSSTSWLECLETYSTKSLTFPSDRIMALIGIATELQKESESCFVPEFGVFEDWLEAQLLWRPLSPKIDADNPLGLPSWCWAATGASKRWLPREPFFYETRAKQRAKQVPRTMILNSSGFIKTHRTLIKAKIAPLPIQNQECCFNHYRNFVTPSSTAPEAELLLHSKDNRCSGKTFLLVDADGTGGILGLASFDWTLYFPECFIMPVDREERSSVDNLHPDSYFQRERAGGNMATLGNVIPDSLNEKNFHSHIPTNFDDAKAFGQTKYALHRENDECVDLFKAGLSKEVHYALLLLRDERLKRFKRVGVAMVWPAAFQTTSSKVTEVDLG